MSDLRKALTLEEQRIQEAYEQRKQAAALSLFNAGNLFMIQEQEREMLALLERRGFTELDRQKILEVGCGAGYWLRELMKWGASPENLTGVDLLPDRIELARRLCPAGVSLQCGSAAHLSFPDASFDLVLQSTVFSSILDDRMKQAIAAEMLRVLKPDGVILWYDSCVNNPRNPHVRGIKKPEIQQLFPGCLLELRRITLAPPLSRLLAPYSLLGCQILSWLPWLRTFYLGAIRKPGVGGGPK
jgi:ubiquinone/menaquinone biosynthesis C-methylase UbiE